MTIEKKANGSELTLILVGKLDTSTAPQLETELKKSIDGIESLVLDFSGLAYVSSAGMRVLLATQKIMNKQGSMLIRHVNEYIHELFEMTGFCDIMTIGQ